MDNTDKINLPDNVPNGEEHPKDGGSPIRVYGPAEPVVVVYGPASMPEPARPKKEGFFEHFRKKLQPETTPEPVAVYGPAEWFESKTETTTSTSPLGVYGPAEWVKGETEEPLDVYGPAEWFDKNPIEEPIDMDDSVDDVDKPSEEDKS